ncbi:MAG: M14 family metallopeptidase [Exilispira sp.]
MIEIFKDFTKIENQVYRIRDELKNFYKEVILNEIGGCFVLSLKNDNTDKHLILQSGLHGIEGYAGFAMINHFIEKYVIESYDSKDFIKNYDISLIINTNPYGVKNKRRVNENNVDLNRNFMPDEKDFKNQNDQYYLIDEVINPKKRIVNFHISYVEAIFGVLKLVLKIGASKFKTILLAGQRYNSNGVYYMGEEYQIQTRNLIKIYEQLFEIKGFENTIFIDLHTGYGPAFNMSIVNSYFMKENDFTQKLKNLYGNIVQSNTDSFYTMNGDLIDFIYKKYPFIKYATAFEFGTFGDNLIAGMKSVIAIILENQYFYNNLNGSKNNFNFNDKTGQKVLRFYEIAYLPEKKKWWEKAVIDFDKAIKGILSL